MNDKKKNEQENTFSWRIRRALTVSGIALNHCWAIRLFHFRFQREPNYRQRRQAANENRIASPFFRNLRNVASSVSILRVQLNHKGT